MPIGAPGLKDVVAGNIGPFMVGHHAAGEPWTPRRLKNVRVADNLDLALCNCRDLCSGFCRLASLSTRSWNQACLRTMLAAAF